VNSLNPYRLQGQKTAAFELVDDLGRAPDLVAMPFGGGGNLCAYALGFGELEDDALLVGGESSERATTLASAIRIAQPVHREEVDELVESGRARVETVDDAEIVDAWRELATLEGVFCEPSSAAGLAAVKKLDLDPGSVVVCVVTGHGLKDAEAVDLITDTSIEVDANLDSILAEVA
jgi:threonine synthase